MATVLRKTSAAVQVMADAHNDLKAQIGAGAFFHLDAYETPVASPTATDLPTALALANELIGTYTAHMNDTLAHKVVGVALASTARVFTLATSITAANDIKAKYNVHRASTTFHYNADATDVTAAADATDLASLLTLLNELKADINLHLASAPSAKSLRVVDA